MGQARADLEACVAWHARALGVRVRRIGLRDQTTRWGSCSASGLLSFSWRLVLAPAHVLDYVAAHEVAHLRRDEPWRALLEAGVASGAASSMRPRHWLRHEGTDLHRYGAVERGLPAATAIKFQRTTT